MSHGKKLKIMIVAGSRGSISQLRPEYECFIRIAECGHDVTIVIEPESVYSPRLREAGIRMLDCYPHKKIDVSSIRALRAELRHQPYDIIYATTSKTIPNAAFAAIGFDAKLVAYRGTTGGLYRHDPTAYFTILNPRVDGVICVSEAVRADVLQRIWKNHDHVVTIHKGHELDWYSQPPANLATFSIGDNDFVVICAVNARPSKGIDVMLDAADNLADLTNLHLLLVGKGMDMEPYSSLIARNRLRDRIHVTGFRTDAPALIAASDVLVQPSRSGEGLPRAVMEAMGSGTPVIVTDTGGSKEIVEDGISGFVVGTQDPGAIADRIRQLHADPTMRSRMSESAREQLRTKFSASRTAERYIRYFLDLSSDSNCDTNLQRKQNPTQSIGPL